MYKSLCIIGKSFICGGVLFFADFTDVTKKLEAGLTEEVKVKEPVNQQIHRMCLLRVKLMHFVNSLHNYIMTRVRGLDLMYCGTDRPLSFCRVTYTVYVHVVNLAGR